MHTVNLKTALHACKAALPHLLERAGRVVNIGAGAAGKAAAGMGAYAASKAGVLRLTEALSEETKDRGMTVNAILPGIIDTPANRKDMPDADTSRWVTPQAIAEVVGFLLSDAARAVTGVGLPVTGGCSGSATRLSLRLPRRRGPSGARRCPHTARRGSSAPASARPTPCRP